ncbi:MAG: aldehyde reductase [Candidatus Wallbacteria bacterium GWC2_49_35]|uniref:Aldehyde reductase n=1 Tax=Candidatus Wallbacteria bacterium GWC2_49_35 TaxID=1817813 RepID=A0A1F7WMF7_9BACT|nr:MAG: aldehyde reductase [Candidatus Wallbacteria bacterium GWC2_49_35]HBC74082.1 NADH-dependent alcohol dehydrogenase [Candidatus Wallbacteria bacterium]
MLNFDFYNPTHIIFGKDRLDEIDKNTPAGAKVLITYGGGSAKKSGLIDKVKTALGKRKIFEFGGIEPNPRYETLMKAVEVVKNENIDFLLAVGGGSAIDGTKFISLASFYKGDASDLLKFGLSTIPPEVTGKAVPIGTVLTLPATGSEMNCGAVISYGHGKFSVLCALTFPRYSILDPTLTFTLPEIQVANGIIDAFVHTTEQYLTFPVDGRVQDRIAEGILQTLIEIGKTTVSEPQNYGARANHVWCATLALNGIVGAGVPQDWATHMIGHELTAMFGIDHGQTLAIILPALLEVRRDKKRAKLLQYAERVWHIDSGSEEAKIDLAIRKTREFFESLGVKTRLSQHGVGAEKIPALVEQLKAHGMTALSETGDLTPDISQKILETAM